MVHSLRPGYPDCATCLSLPTRRERSGSDFIDVLNHTRMDTEQETTHILSDTPWEEYIAIPASAWDEYVRAHNDMHGTDPDPDEGWPKAHPEVEAASRRAQTQVLKQTADSDRAVRYAMMRKLRRLLLAEASVNAAAEKTLGIRIIA